MSAALPIAASTGPRLAPSADVFRCEQLRCVLAKSACVARQATRIKAGKTRSVPLHRMCGPVKAGGESPCAQGRAIWTEVGGAPVHVVTPGFRPKAAPVPRPKPAPAPELVAAPAAAPTKEEPMPRTSRSNVPPPAERRELLRAFLVERGQATSAEIGERFPWAAGNAGFSVIHYDLAKIGARHVGNRRSPFALGAPAPRHQPKPARAAKAPDQDAQIAERLRALAVEWRTRASSLEDAATALERSGR